MELTAQSVALLQKQEQSARHVAQRFIRERQA